MGFFVAARSLFLTMAAGSSTFFALLSAAAFSAGTCAPFFGATGAFLAAAAFDFYFSSSEELFWDYFLFVELAAVFFLVLTSWLEAFDDADSLVAFFLICYFFASVAFLSSTLEMALVACLATGAGAAFLVTGAAAFAICDVFECVEVSVCRALK